MDVKNQDIIHRPKRMSNISKKNLTKYCHFHRKYGHDIEYRLTLKEEIEALVHQCYLWAYISQPKDVETSDHQP